MHPRTGLVEHCRLETLPEEDPELLLDEELVGEPEDEPPPEVLEPDSVSPFGDSVLPPHAAAEAAATSEDVAMTERMRC